MSRKIMKTEGSMVAAEGEANVTASSGSAGDLMRDSAMEGGLAHSQINLQGGIQENAFRAQADAYTASASAMDAAGHAADSAAKGAEFGAAFKVAGALFSLF